MLCRVVRLSEDRARRLFAAPENVFGAGYPEIDLDKAWHVLSLLLAGDFEGEGPAAFLVEGGTEVGEDLGYGPPRLFMPEEVEAIVPEVARATEAGLRALDGHEALDSVYGGWEGALGEEEFRYYADRLAALKAFVAGSQGGALLVELY